MKTITEIVREAAALNYPGCVFAEEIIIGAEKLIEKEAQRVSAKALRKSVLAYRPVSLPKTHVITKIEKQSHAAPSGSASRVL